MKKLIFPFLFLVITFPLSAQSLIDSLMNEAHEMVLAKKESKALSNYKAVINLDTGNTKALTQASILTARAGRRQPSKALKEKLFAQARVFAVRSLRNNSNSAKANVAMADALNELALLSGAKEKINLLKDVKDFLDKALLIDSSYAKAWYLLGKWNMELSSLNFAERTAAKLLFGGMPDAGLGKAITAFEECRSLDPAFIPNYYHLAQAYDANERDLKAIATLKQALHLRPILQDDLAIQQKCKEMMEKLQ